MKKPPRQVLGATPVTPENYTPLTMHEVIERRAPERQSPARDPRERSDAGRGNSERKPTEGPLHVNPKVRNRGPGSRQKRTKLGWS